MSRQTNLHEMALMLAFATERCRLDEAEWETVSAKRGMKSEERLRDQFTEALN
jgi:hypothetical protein